MVSFTCNVCGAFNEVSGFTTEAATCGCGSNVRVRALVHLLSRELFGRSLTLTRFPRLKSIRGLGLSDKACYAEILAEKFDYTNTFYGGEPDFDLTAAHPQLAGSFDFILAADVLEHVAPPLERALDEAFRLLRPHGFLGITVYCNPEDAMREYFPHLHDYRIVRLGDRPVLVNRRADGALETAEDLVFHDGQTLEMREFGRTGLRAGVIAAGFASVEFLTAELPEIGILFDGDLSQPLVARKAPFAWSGEVRKEMLDLWSVERGVRRVPGSANPHGGGVALVPPGEGSRHRPPPLQSERARLTANPESNAAQNRRVPRPSYCAPQARSVRSSAAAKARMRSPRTSMPVTPYPAGSTPLYRT